MEKLTQLVCCKERQILFAQHRTNVQATSGEWWVTLGILDLLNPALDMLSFLINALVSIVEHFFESIEFTFHYARKLCFDQ